MIKRSFISAILFLLGHSCQVWALISPFPSSVSVAFNSDNFMKSGEQRVITNQIQSNPRNYHEFQKTPQCKQTQKKISMFSSPPAVHRGTHLLIPLIPGSFVWNSNLLELLKLLATEWRQTGPALQLSMCSGTTRIK